MPTDAVASHPIVCHSPDPPALPGRWSDRAWTHLVGGFDAVLQRIYGVYEFTADPECILRIELGRARAPAALSDGTVIEKGEVIAILHFWNEHLPRFPRSGPNLSWAKLMQRRMHHSLEALALHVPADPELRQVRAFRGDAALASHLRAQQLRRLARRHDFDLVAPDNSAPLRRLQLFGENILLWGLARAFNPACLRHMRFSRSRQELWISRQALLRRYGDAPAAMRPSTTTRHRVVA